ncbi:MAG TPA: hypothetical protein VHO48_10335 [Anaerolineaceae bacterium]|nr:hypothetical protein [Anaerolineaceae bacterium]
MKPLCRMTIKDLLDQMDEQEPMEKEKSTLFTPNQLVYSLVSLEETAYLLDVDPETLVKGLREPVELSEQKTLPVPFFRDLDVRL